jgi:arginyl-tRNA synthetase
MRPACPTSTLDLEKPKQPEHGDWATTAALRLAKPAKRNPREIAQLIVDHLEVPEVVDEVSIAGPGFVNFRLPTATTGTWYGGSSGGAQSPTGVRPTKPGDTRETVNVEFVSANPTGSAARRRRPVGGDRRCHRGADRGAGDEVVREYYVNDAGEQIRRFGESVVLVATGEELGDDHYRGHAIREVADQLRAGARRRAFTESLRRRGRCRRRQSADARADGRLVEDRPALARCDRRGSIPASAPTVGVLGVEAMRQRIQDVLHQMGVDYDVWFSEREGLHDTGASTPRSTELTERGRPTRRTGRCSCAPPTTVTTRTGC